MQWGFVNPTTSPEFVSFPTTFPNAVFSINVTVLGDGKRSGAVATEGDGGEIFPAPTTTGAWMGVGEGSHSSWEVWPFYWTAIGN
jgi:hypothetical protein